MALCGVILFTHSMNCAAVWFSPRCQLSLSVPAPDAFLLARAAPVGQFLYDEWKTLDANTKIGISKCQIGLINKFKCRIFSKRKKHFARPRRLYRQDHSRGRRLTTTGQPTNSLLPLLTSRNVTFRFQVTPAWLPPRCFLPSLASWAVLR